MTSSLAGVFLALSGPAGAGKDTVTCALEARTGFRKHPSVTTRPMRPGESPSRPYTFVSDAEFDALRGAGRLWNEVSVGGHRYGIRRDELARAYEAGERLVLHLTPAWARRLKSEFPNTILVLLTPPGLDEQLRRLRARGATLEEIRRRLEDDEVQNPSRDGFDLVLVNHSGRVDEAVDALVRLVEERAGARDGTLVSDPHPTAGPDVD